MILALIFNQIWDFNMKNVLWKPLRWNANFCEICLVKLLSKNFVLNKSKNNQSYIKFKPKYLGQ